MLRHPTQVKPLNHLSLVVRFERLNAVAATTFANVRIEGLLGRDKFGVLGGCPLWCSFRTQVGYHGTSEKGHKRTLLEWLETNALSAGEHPRDDKALKPNASPVKLAVS
jgi:hypothetical protein